MALNIGPVTNTYTWAELCDNVGRPVYDWKMKQWLVISGCVAHTVHYKLVRQLKVTNMRRTFYVTFEEGRFGPQCTL